jgi:plastocyanin
VRRFHHGNKRMRRHLLTIGFLSLGCVTSFAQGTGTVVVQRGRAFHPTEVTIQRGDTITFTNSDSFIHQIYVSGLFDSEEKAPGQDLNETFPVTGTFQVRCHIHPTMHLVVRVK